MVSFAGFSTPKIELPPPNPDFDMGACVWGVAAFCFLFVLFFLTLAEFGCSGSAVHQVNPHKKVGPWCGRCVVVNSGACGSAH